MVYIIGSTVLLVIFLFCTLRQIVNPSNRTLTLYADYVCPFCYLEQQSLVEYRQSHPNHPLVNWLPYDIRHQKRTTGGFLDTQYDIGYPEQVHTKISKLAQKHDDGTMLSPADVPLVDSLPAQIVSWYIKHEHPNRWFAFTDRIFTALWCNGEDISDTGVLRNIAEESGLNRNAIDIPLKKADAREQVLTQCAEARHAGVDDVPTLIYESRSLHEVTSANKLAEFIHERG